jgi:hypothetical protein
MFALLMALAVPVLGQGMPLEVRANIHTLLGSHTQMQREVTLTPDGYEAVTQSTNSRVTTALQEHVRQMQERLDGGLAVRRWDPAFAEYRAHYEEIDFTVNQTAAGVRVVANGQTPEGVTVAQNHAGVIDMFVDHGWAEHDQTHPAAVADMPPGPHPPSPRGQCRSRDGSGKRSGGVGCQGGRKSGRFITAITNPQPKEQR